MDEIINKVAQSGLITIDPAEFYPAGEVVELDIKDWLFEGMILKEKLFRQHLTEFNAEKLKDKVVAVTCSSDAIIPTWAFMLIGARLAPVAKKIFSGSKDQITEHLILESVESMDLTPYKDERVVIKGCSDPSIPPSAYLALASKLQPVAKSIMYGEACSTVPVYKKKND